MNPENRKTGKWLKTNLFGIESICAGIGGGIGSVVALYKDNFIYAGIGGGIGYIGGMLLRKIISEMRQNKGDK